MPPRTLPHNTVITIDGLSASGKSSIAKALAAALGVPYVSSGLLYRALTWLTLETQTEPRNPKAVLELLAHHRIELRAHTEGNQAWIDDHDRSHDCHSSRVDAHVSTIALHPELREWVNATLREIAPPFVAEGRDMGRVVFPDAQKKIFLTASLAARAARRAKERPEDTTVVLQALQTRDTKDAINSAPAPDAVVLDSTELDFAQTLQAALRIVT